MLRTTVLVLGYRLGTPSSVNYDILYIQCIIYVNKINEMIFIPCLLFTGHLDFLITILTNQIFHVRVGVPYWGDHGVFQ